MPTKPPIHRPLSAWAPGPPPPTPPHPRTLSQRKADRRRAGRHERGYTNAWARASAAFLDRHPLCRHCLAHGVRRAAVVTDHVVPHRGDPALFWDEANWQPLCKPHHDHKTATEDRRSLAARPGRKSRTPP